MKSRLHSSFKFIFFVIVAFASIVSLVNAQACHGTRSTMLDVNQVRAAIQNGGEFWEDANSYQLPTLPGVSTRRAVFERGGLWISALDQGSNIVNSCLIRRSGLEEYSVGPIFNNTQTAYSYADHCAAYDRIFEMTRSQVQDHINRANQGLPIPTTSIDHAILDWPALNNPHFPIPILEDLAPFVDVNSNGIYDPENGDYPEIKGDQAFFYAINSNTSTLINPSGASLPINICVLSYAYDDPNGITDMATFYDISLVNKSISTFSDLKVGIYTVNKLGNPSDDYVGCDPSRNASYLYNSTPADIVFSSNIPIVSTVFLNKTMSSFMRFYLNPRPDQGMPDIEQEFRNYMNGIWKDGTRMTLGGEGYSATSTNYTNFAFSGNPSDASAWSEASAGTQAGQRNTVQTFSNANPFLPQDRIDFSFAVTAVYPSNYNGAPDLTTSLYPHLDDLQQLYIDSLQYGNRYSNTISSTSQLDESQVSIYPNPAQDVLIVDLTTIEAQELIITNVNGQILKQKHSEFQDHIEVDIELLPAGIYFIQVQTKQGVLTQKFVKQ